MTGEHWGAWSQILVAQKAPYFLTAELAQQLPKQAKIYTRSGPDHNDLALSFKDSYGTHFVDQAFKLTRTAPATLREIIFDFGNHGPAPNQCEERYRSLLR